MIRRVYMTTNVKKKKSAREKRILVASLIVAAVMIGGSTFAWFTSKDEVTNRLSANAKYDVSIAEDFQPPENWVPGQQINKDVSAVNTGNVDAFVLKMSDAQYYNQSEVKYGYFRGSETYDYVNSIRARWSEYKKKIKH